MFGKGSKKMSNTDKFIMAKGRAAGNVANFGNNKGGKGGEKGKDSPAPFKPRTLRVGKNSGFSVE